MEPPLPPSLTPSLRYRNYQYWLSGGRAVSISGVLLESLGLIQVEGGGERPLNCSLGHLIHVCVTVSQADSSAVGQAEPPRHIHTALRHPACSVLPKVRSPPPQTPSNPPAVCWPLMGVGAELGGGEEVCVRDRSLEGHISDLSFLSGDREGRVIYSFSRYLLST